jgi:xylulokinase
MSKTVSLVRTVLGVDIGTFSSKGILVTLDGEVLGSSTRLHEVSRPGRGMVEMDADVWWQEFADISSELLTRWPSDVVSVGVSGMGPCVLLAEDSGAAIRPAILYGVDTRATEHIKRLTELLGQQNIVDRCGSALSSQSVGPKLLWVRENEPSTMDEAKYLFMPSSWLGFKLTGSYVLDHHSAIQCTPMYDTKVVNWHKPWVDLVAPDLDLPQLVWPGDVIGTASEEASTSTLIPVGR